MDPTRPAAPTRAPQPAPSRVPSPAPTSMPTDASCADGFFGGDETDTDCGGSCPPCAIGEMCAYSGDCTSDACVNGQASFWYSQGCFIGCPECDHRSGRVQTDLCGLGAVATNNGEARSVNLNATPGSADDGTSFRSVCPPAYERWRFRAGYGGVQVFHT